MFIDEPIQVETKGTPLRPISFTWRDKKFRVLSVESAWQDWKFGLGGPRKRSWHQRRHRNYYRVVADSGDVFELYLDRAGSKREWILYQQLPSSETPS